MNNFRNKEGWKLLVQPSGKKKITTNRKGGEGKKGGRKRERDRKQNREAEREVFKCSPYMLCM